jgi:hypothetical protein
VCHWVYATINSIFIISWTACCCHCTHSIYARRWSSKLLVSKLMVYNGNWCRSSNIHSHL